VFGKASVGRGSPPHSTGLLAMVGPPRDRRRTVRDDVEEGTRLSCMRLTTGKERSQHSHTVADVLAGVGAPASPCVAHHPRHQGRLPVPIS
jgi:hypothetical protein